MIILTMAARLLSAAIPSRQICCTTSSAFWFLFTITTPGSLSLGICCSALGGLTLGVLTLGGSTPTP